MARAGSAWSVKGVDEDTRAIARARAGASDLTIGAWVDQAILAYAIAEPPQQPAGETLHAAEPKPSVPGSPQPVPHSRTSPSLSDQDVLDLIDQELGASRSRLDGALRPVGYALKDLALRLVAAEALERGDNPRARLPKSNSAGSDAGGLPSAIKPAEPARPPVAPLGSLAPTIMDAEIPTPAVRRPSPEPPTYALDPRLDGIEPPRVAATQPAPAPTSLAPKDLLGPDEASRPDPAPPTETMATIDPADMPEPVLRPRPVPPEADLSGPVSIPSTDPPLSPPAKRSLEIREETQVEPVDDSGVRFQGVQTGFESNPDQAVFEARETSRRRYRRIAAGVIPFLIVGSLGAAFVFAEPLGISSTRDVITARAMSHARQTVDTLSDAFTVSRKKIAGLVEEARTLAGDNPPVPQEPEPKTTEPPLEVVEEKPESSSSRPKVAALELPPVQRRKPTSPAGEDQDKDQIRPQPAVTLKPDDPSIENLAETPSRQSAVGTSTAVVSAPPKPVVKPADRPLKLATRPPPPPVLSKPEIIAPVKKPSPPTRLAALPKAPTLEADKIPPSGTSPGVTIQALKAAARAGDPRSQHELGRRLLRGEGVDQDLAEASEWFREAAIQGVANAQYNLAVLYERGLGVTKDDVRALLWYHSAAEQSHPHAQYNLGIFYLQGRGIPLSYGEAVRWFRAASGQGIVKATYNLAVLTEDGLGVPPNKAKAQALYEKAADAGHRSAADRLAILRDPNAAKPKPATFEETATTQNQDLSTATTVSEIQALLRQDGIYSGRVDGIAGPKTRTAIREFQKRNDLPITGIPSETLLNFMTSGGPSS